MKKLLLVIVLFLVIASGHLFGVENGQAISRDNSGGFTRMKVVNSNATTGSTAGFKGTNSGNESISVYVEPTIDGADGYVVTDTGDLYYNVPTGKGHYLQINGSTVFSADATDVKYGNNYIVYDDKKVTNLEGTGLSIAAGVLNADVMTQEEVEDFVGGMVAGNTETRIDVTYQDVDGTLDFVVEDMYDGDPLSTEEVQDIAGGMWTGNTETLITVTYQDAENNIDAVVNNDLHAYSWTNVVDDDIPDAITVGATGSVNDGAIPGGITRDTEWDTAAKINAATTDNDFAISGGAEHDSFSDYVANEHIDWTIDQGATNIHAGNYIDTNTQLTDEQVQDIVGGMVTGNTETRIDVEYQDDDGTLDFAVDDMNDDVPDAGDFGAATALDANGAIVDDYITVSMFANGDWGDVTVSSNIVTIDDIGNKTVPYSEVIEFLASGATEPDTNGNWKMVLTASGFEIQKYETDSWVTKSLWD